MVVSNLLNICCICIFIIFSSEFIICKNHGVKSSEDYFEISYYSYESPAGSITELNNSRVIIATDRVKDLSLVCKSSKCPVEWKLEKYRYANFPDDLKEDIRFKSVRFIDGKDYSDKSKYNYSSEINFGGSEKFLTGNYICSCTTDPNKKHSVYLYWEGSSSSLFLQGGQHFEVFKGTNSPWVTLFCGVSKNNASIYLFKEKGVEKVGKIYESIFPNASVTVDTDGFHLNVNELEFPDGIYVCSTLKTITTTTSPLIYARYTVINVPNVERPLYNATELEKLPEQTRSTVFFESYRNALVCCGTGELEWSQVGFWCESVQKCNYLAHKLVKRGQNARDGNDTCSSFIMGVNLSPMAATFRCSMANWDAQGTMFFSLDSRTYFSGDHFNPDSMVRIIMVSKLPNYVGAALRFNCSSSQYLFSEGLIWVGIFENGTTLLIDKLLKNDYYNVDQADQLKNAWIEVRIFNPEISSISCLVPVWNSDEWINATMPLNFTVSQKPSFDERKNLNEVLIQPATNKVVLRCRANGVPLPEIHWFKDLKDILLATTQNISETEVSSEVVVQIPADVKTVVGTYVCAASNSIGTERWRINLQVEPEGYGLIIGITIGLLILFSIVVVFLVRKVFTQRKALRQLTEAEINEFEQGNPEALKNWKDDINGCTHLLPYNSSYEIPPTNLIIDNTKILGQGTFGIVVKGSVRTGTIDTIVAIKTIRPNEDVSNFKVLLSELKIMAFIGRHENIVSLVGASSRNIRKRELMIAIEFCDNGSLFDFLRKHRRVYRNTLNPDARESFVEGNPNSYQNDPLTHQYANQPNVNTNGYQNDPSEVKIVGFSAMELVLWSIQIANGMEFLATKRVIHSDLATRNILLTGDMSAKVGDFGLSKHLFEYSTYTKKTMALLPWKWMAIESLRDMEFSVMSDVWSYGVLLWELFTLAEVPYPGLTWTNEFMENLKSGFRLAQPQYASADIYEVMLKCMRPEPMNRPSFTTLKDWQTKIYQRIQSSTS